MQILTIILFRWALPAFLIQLFLYIVTMNMSRKKLRFVIRRIPLFSLIISNIGCMLLISNVFNLANIFDIDTGIMGASFAVGVYWNVIFPFVLGAWVLAWVVYLIIEKIYRNNNPYTMDSDISKYEKPIGEIHKKDDSQ